MSLSIPKDENDSESPRVILHATTVPLDCL